MVNKKEFTMGISEIEAKCRLISSGTSRKVYELNEEWVAKVPFNEAGKQQNRFEVRTYEKFRDTKYESLLVPCIIVEQSGLVFMKKWEALPKIICTTIAEFVETNHPGAAFPGWDLIKSFIQASGLFWEDVYDCSAWAVSGTQVALIDYGCSNEIFQKFYAGSW